MRWTLLTFVLCGAIRVEVACGSSCCILDSLHDWIKSVVVRNIECGYNVYLAMFVLSLGPSAKDGASGACPTSPPSSPSPTTIAITDPSFLPSSKSIVCFLVVSRFEVTVACCSAISLAHYEQPPLSSPRHARPRSHTPHLLTNTSSSAQCQQQ